MPRATVKLKVVDKGWRHLLEVVKAIKQHDTYVKVGVLDDGAGAEEREGGITNAELAAIHEFGSKDGHIPERSFIRSTFNANSAEYVKLMKELLIRFVEGKLVLDDVFNLLGLRISTDIKKRVTSGDQIQPPNAPSTIWKKTGRERDAANTALASAQNSARENKMTRMKAINQAEKAFSQAAQNGPLRRGEASKHARAIARATNRKQGASARSLNAAARAVGKLIDAQGQVRTLIDTGRMINSVTWAVVNGTGKDE